MTAYPEFDPLHAPEDPPQIELPSPFEEEDQPFQLEGMIFSPYLSADDLTGSRVEAAPPMPRLPSVVWDDAPVPEAAVLRAMAEARRFAKSDRPPAPPPAETPRASSPTPAPTPAPAPTPKPAPGPPLVQQSERASESLPAPKHPVAPAPPSQLPAEVASPIAQPSEAPLPQRPNSPAIAPRKNAIPLGRPVAQNLSSLYGNLADASRLEAERHHNSAPLSETASQNSVAIDAPPTTTPVAIPAVSLAQHSVTPETTAEPAQLAGPSLYPDTVTTAAPADSEATETPASGLSAADLTEAAPPDPKLPEADPVDLAVPDAAVPDAAVPDAAVADAALPSIAGPASTPPASRPLRRLPRTSRWTSRYTASRRVPSSIAIPEAAPGQPAEAAEPEAAASAEMAAKPEAAASPEKASGPPSVDLLPAELPSVNPPSADLPEAPLPSATEPPLPAPSEETPPPVAETGLSESAPEPPASQAAPLAPTEEKLAVLEASPLTAVPYEVSPSDKLPPAIALPSSPILLQLPLQLPVVDKKLSVLEAPMPLIENSAFTAATETHGTEAPTPEPADSSVAPQLHEGLVEILAFQPQHLAIAAVEPVLPHPAEPHRPLFQTFYKPAHEAPMQVRIPHFGHLAVLVLLLFAGLAGSTELTRGAIHLHLFGVTTAATAATDIHYTIGFMAGIYLITFALAAIVFPLWWQRGFFSGLQWNIAGAGRKILPLLGAAVVCFVLALVDQIALPGPTNAPIDKMFDSATAAWLLLVFGVTFAPFFEEIFFRGFLLPALCTAFDWYGEKLNGNPPNALDANGHPQWSLLAMTLASICTSIPFAGMHAEQTGYSLGPFVLLVTVSMILCWARLRMRSLAASMIVHASYNGLLFSIMLAGTGGFKHLDKM